MNTETPTPPADWKETARQLAAFDPDTFGPPPDDDRQSVQDRKDAAEVAAMRAEVAELRRLALARLKPAA